jgi:hypothetical protein
LEDDRGILVASRFESSDYGGGGRDIDGGDGVALLLSMIEERLHVVADNDTGLAGENVFGTAGLLAGAQKAVMRPCSDCA